MKPHRRTRLFLEQLENRVTPSISIFFSAGNLNITGTPIHQLEVDQTAAGVFHVQDLPTVGIPTPGPIDYGSYRVTGNLNIMLARHPDVINVNLNTFTFNGNVLIDLGRGDPNSHPVNVFGAAAGGAVGGNVTFRNGSGVETINIGQPALAPLPVRVGGSVFATLKVSTGGFVGPGDTLFVGPGSTVGGDVIASQVDNLDIGEFGLALTTVGGNVYDLENGSNAAANLHIFGQVNKDVTMVGTHFEDVFTLGPAGAGVGGTINGNVNVYLGQGGGMSGDSISLEAGSTINGNATFTTGTPTGAIFIPTVDIAGTVNGTLTLTLGNGSNAVNFEATGVVGGNLSITGGNGTNDLGGGTLGGAFAGTVNGNVYISLGNGTNNLQVAAGASLNGVTFNYQGGTGNDTVEFDNAGTENLNVNLGGGVNGPDTFIWGAGASAGAATIDFGTHTGFDSYTPPTVFTFPIVLKNFP